VDRERVHAAGKLGSERRVDHAMALQPALPTKRFRYDIESEMRLTAGPVSGMAFMTMRFVLDVQAFGRESAAQLFGDDIACLHRYCLKVSTGKVATGFSAEVMARKSRRAKPSPGIAANARRLALLPLSSLEGAIDAPA
jgi:hypothetical protein